MCEPLSVGIWACHRANLQAGDAVLVTGAGPGGIFAAQTARALGAGSVTITDVSPFRLDMAQRLRFETEHGEQPGEGQFDVLLECSGAPGVLAQGLGRLTTNGRAALVGMPKKPVELPLSNLNVNELTIGLVNRYAHTWPTAIELISSGRVDAASIVTHHFPLDEAEAGITLLERDPSSMKAIIHPQPASE